MDQEVGSSNLPSCTSKFKGLVNFAISLFHVDCRANQRLIRRSSCAADLPRQQPLPALRAHRERIGSHDQQVHGNRGGLSGGLDRSAPASGRWRAAHARAPVPAPTALVALTTTPNLRSGQQVDGERRRNRNPRCCQRRWLSGPNDVTGWCGIGSGSTWSASRSATRRRNWPASGNTDTAASKQAREKR